MSVADEWRAEAACADIPVGVFFPTPEGATTVRFGRVSYRRDGYSEGQVAKARAVCAGCSVVRACLIADLRLLHVNSTSASGLRSGTGGLGRRRLLRAMRDLDHPPEIACKDPECGWCRDVDALQTNLDVVAGRAPREAHVRIEANGPHATHGRKSTGARGCRCGPCRSARKTEAQQLSRIVDYVLFVEWVTGPIPEHAGSAPSSTADFAALAEEHAEVFVELIARATSEMLKIAA